MASISAFLALVVATIGALILIQEPGYELAAVSVVAFSAIGFYFHTKSSVPAKASLAPTGGKKWGASLAAKVKQQVAKEKVDASDLPVQEVVEREFGLGCYAGWELAREITGDQWMRIWVRVRDGELGFRLTACADASVSQYICFLQEFDLLPSWIKYAKKSGVLRQLVSSVLNSIRTQAAKISGSSVYT